MLSTIILSSGHLKPSSRVIVNSVSMWDVQLSLFTGKRRKRFISFEFRSDVFQLQRCYKNSDKKKGYKSFNSQEFNPIYSTPGWDMVYYHLVDRCRIHFPVE